MNLNREFYSITLNGKKVTFVFQLMFVDGQRVKQYTYKAAVLDFSVSACYNITFHIDTIPLCVYSIKAIMVQYQSTYKLQRQQAYGNCNINLCHALSTSVWAILVLWYNIFGSISEHPNLMLLYVNFNYAIFAYSLYWKGIRVHSLHEHYLHQLIVAQYNLSLDYRFQYSPITINCDNTLVHYQSYI